MIVISSGLTTPCRLPDCALPCSAYCRGLGIVTFTIRRLFIFYRDSSDTETVVGYFYLLFFFTIRNCTIRHFYNRNDKDLCCDFLIHTDNVEGGGGSISFLFYLNRHCNKSILLKIYYAVIYASCILIFLI